MLRQRNVDRVSNVPEKLSDSETEKVLQQFSADIWERMKGEGFFEGDFAGYPREEIILLCAEYVARHFPVVTQGPGLHTLGAFLALDHDNFLRNVQRGERDCKVTAVLAASIFERASLEFGLLLELRLAVVGSQPHPFVRVVFLDEPEKPFFVDFTGGTGLEVNNNYVLNQFWRMTQGQLHRYEELSLDASGLARLDECFVNYVPKS